MRPRLPKAARAARDEEIKRLLAEGVTADEVAKRLDCHVSWVDGIRRDLGIPTARVRGARKGSHQDMSVARAMLSECDRRLGKGFVRRLLGHEPDLESADLVRLHAAVRFVAVGAEDMLGVVLARLAVCRRVEVDELATRGFGEVGL